MKNIRTTKQLNNALKDGLRVGHATSTIDGIIEVTSSIQKVING